MSRSTKTPDATALPLGRARKPSPRQVAANRANAARSTGPRTPEGKARSARNATKHGFRAALFAIVRIEDAQELENLRADLINIYEPANSQELMALNRMALAQLSILRAARLEAGLFTMGLSHVLDTIATRLNQELQENTHLSAGQQHDFFLAEGFHSVNKQANSWSLLLRYKAQAERDYRRALEEFERLKALRDELPNEPNLAETATNQTASAPAPDGKPPLTAAEDFPERVTEPDGTWVIVSSRNQNPETPTPEPEFPNS